MIAGAHHSAEWAMAVLFFILSTLCAIEASTSIARYVGIQIGSLAGGFSLQSGLSLLSRMLMAVFMPMLGYMADKGLISDVGYIFLFLLSLGVPCALLLVLLFRDWIASNYIGILRSMLTRGGYFPFRRELVSMRRRGRFLGRSISARRLVIVTVLSYIPYYLAWPVTMLLISRHPDNRGFIMGLTSVLNGVNTITLVLFVDPFLVRLAGLKNVSQDVYSDQLWVRILSGVLASFLFLLFAFCTS
ncbi:hypothetical protein DEH84_13850 [Aquabacterium olei]|uniref:Uncharacterized protein n=1 Tax=Aquabacterium olei TaxID=1296669 RepID=A0A2U8FVZ9_9BURK|nr:hypothetical protein [Aquabacterium olei]AWI54386.1 hypothetical protein DEH84_13850 [Aquabacterium olei]